MASTQRAVKAGEREGRWQSSQLTGLLTVALGGLLVALAMGGYLFR